MKIAWIIGCATLLAAGCQFNKSASVDLSTGLSTKGDGLGAQDVELSANGEMISRNDFFYGEKIGLHFNNIEGFERKGGQVYPGMRMLIVGKDGDTILNNPDLYADYSDPITMSPLVLSAHFVVRRPMKPGKSYTVYIHIWDKKGKGTFDAELDMKVAADPAIKTKTTHASYDYIYLFDEKAGKSIAQGKIRGNQEIYMIFEGLEGFTSVDGMSQVGMSMVARDKSGKLLLDEHDLMQDNIVINTAQFAEQFTGIFSFPGAKPNTPIRLEVTVWDKAGDAKVESVVELEVQ